VEADDDASLDLSTALDTRFEIGGREFRSRLMVGTGKYASNAQMIAAIEASGAEVVTVAVRRVDLDRTKDEGILHHLDPQRFMLLANTAGCFRLTTRFATRGSGARPASTNG
jgi:thiazole synthase ThiGH ThiG subunit